MREGEVVEDVYVGLAGVCEGYVREGDIAGHEEVSDGKRLICSTHGSPMLGAILRLIVTSCV